RRSVTTALPPSSVRSRHSYRSDSSVKCCGSIVSPNAAAGGGFSMDEDSTFCEIDFQSHQEKTSSTRNHSWRRRNCSFHIAVAAAYLVMCSRAWAQNWPEREPQAKESLTKSWALDVRTATKRHQLRMALNIVNQRLAESPADMEALGWRARLLAWTNRWTEAEADYRRVLQRFPHDIDMLAGLA